MYHICRRQSFVHVLSFQQVTEVDVPKFAEVVNTAVQSNKSKIANSSLTISSVVTIVNTISALTTVVNQTVMEVGQVLSCAHKNLSAAPLPVECV